MPRTHPAKRVSELENKILKSKIAGRICFTDDERRSLVDAALVMGRKLMESASKLGIIPKVQMFEKENGGLMEAFASL